jgi:ATP-dependent Clp protease protease subunit
MEKATREQTPPSVVPTAKSASAPSASTVATATPQGRPAPAPAAAAQSVPVTYISFVAPITHQSAQILLAACAGLVKKSVQSVYLLFATNGGQVMEGVALYTALCAFPFTLTIHNIGSVNSIGNVIFLAGQRRYAVPSATFLFHGVGFDAVAGMRLEEKFLAERLDSIKADHARLSSIISSRTKLTQQAAEQLFAQQATRDAQYAKTNGIVDDIIDFQMPQGADYTHLTVP